MNFLCKGIDQCHGRDMVFKCVTCIVQVLVFNYISDRRRLREGKDLISGYHIASSPVMVKLFQGCCPFTLRGTTVALGTKVSFAFFFTLSFPGHHRSQFDICLRDYRPGVLFLRAATSPNRDTNTLELI